MNAAIAENLSTAVEAGDSPQEMLKADRIVRVCTIRKPASELYAFWADLENLPQLAKVPLEITSDGAATHWTARSPKGRQHFEWDLVITGQSPSEYISWQSPPGATPVHQGRVEFTPAPGDEGTEVSVTIELNPHEGTMAAWASPNGGLASWVTKLKGEGLKFHINEALRRFKALMEAGEMPTVDGQPSGRRKGKQ